MARRGRAMSRVELGALSSAGVRTLWLDRPDKANALDPQTVEALSAALVEVAAQPPRVLAIEGRGRNFCAGFDFTGYDALGEAELILRFVLIEQMLAALRELPCVTVACVRGGAFGAGADLAAACTFRLGLAGAKFRFPGFQFGLALGTRALAALIGQQAAREILLSGAVVDAERALAIGLLSERLAGEEFAAAIEAISGRFGRLDASSAALALRNTRPHSADADLADLVRSVIRPGLKARIAAYRAGG
jgi:enoyl-CoA hydratase